MNPATNTVIQNWQRLESENLNRFVAIDYERAIQLAKEHALKDFKIPNWRFPGVYPEREFAYVGMQFVANCFNSAYNIFGKRGEKFAVSNPFIFNFLNLPFL